MSSVDAFGHTWPVPTHHVPKPGERPDVEVDIEGVWCPGEVRMWTHNDDDAWFAQVQYRLPGTFSGKIGTFPADRVREDTLDRSQGRT